ncbi:MAG TPA: hypothetical protein VKA34_21695 [Balneolales bacterium]|nr:hypothetical protein [Balneolales bacterium]
MSNRSLAQYLSRKCSGFDIEQNPDINSSIIRLRRRIDWPITYK